MYFSFMLELYMFIDLNLLRVYKGLLETVVITVITNEPIYLAISICL